MPLLFLADFLCSVVLDRLLGRPASGRFFFNLSVTSYLCNIHAKGLNL